jgi:hypothetical protein
MQDYGSSPAPFEGICCIWCPWCSILSGLRWGVGKTLPGMTWRERIIDPWPWYAICKCWFGFLHFPFPCEHREGCVHVCISMVLGGLFFLCSRLVLSNLVFV